MLHQKAKNKLFKQFLLPTFTFVSKKVPKVTYTTPVNVPKQNIRLINSFHVKIDINC